MGTDVSLPRIPVSFFLTSRRLRFHLPLHVHHLYRDIYILNYLQNCNRWARRDLDTFLLIIKEKLPPPFFFFCLKYIPVPPTTVFLNS